VPATTNVTIDYVEVPSGRFINMRNPNPRDITLEDIAHKLAQVNRFGGSVDYPYSVAQHAVFVAERLRRQGASGRLQQLGLHHDDAEAFLGDIPRPWKAMLGDVYKRMTVTFEMAIEEALRLPVLEGMRDVDHQTIKHADNYALLVEARKLLPSAGHRWDYLSKLEGLPSRVVIPDYFLGEIDWRTARDMYLRRHEELTNGAI